MRRMCMAFAMAAALGACDYPDGSPNPTATGATIGTFGGAAAGLLFGGDGRAALVGGVLGAGTGAAVGAAEERRAARLRYP